MTAYNNINWIKMTDDAIIKHIGLFIKEHRISKHKTQEDVANLTGLSRYTISQIERGKSVTFQVLLQVLRGLDLLYVLDHFSITQKVSPLEAVKLKAQKKMRVRKSATPSKGQQPKSDW